MADTGRRLNIGRTAAGILDASMRHFWLIAALSGCFLLYQEAVFSLIHNNRVATVLAVPPGFLGFLSIQGTIAASLHAGRQGNGSRSAVIVQARARLFALVRAFFLKTFAFLVVLVLFSLASMLLLALLAIVVGELSSELFLIFFFGWLAIPSLFLMTRRALITPVVVIEKRGAIAAWRRSSELVRGNARHVIPFIFISYTSLYLAPLGITSITSGLLEQVALTANWAVFLSFDVIAATVIYFELTSMDPILDSASRPNRSEFPRL